MLFLLTDSPQKLKLEKINGTFIILFYVSPSSSQLDSEPFPILQQVTDKNTPILFQRKC